MHFQKFAGGFREFKKNSVTVLDDSVSHLLAPRETPPLGPIESFEAACKECEKKARWQP
jgi:hypothetical protein